MTDRKTGTELAGVRTSAGVLRRMAGAAQAAVGTATLGAAFLLATLTPIGAGVRLPAVLLLVIGLAVLPIVLSWIGRKARTELSLESLASEAERATGLLDGELRAAFELGAVRPGESAELGSAHRQRMSREIAGRSLSDLFPGSSTRWRRVVVAGTAGASAAVGLVVASTLLRPAPTAEAARLWAAPWQALASRPVSELRVIAPASVPRGETAPLRVSAYGRPTVTVYEHAAGEPKRYRELAVHSASGVAEARSGPIRTRTRLWAEDPAGRVSERVEIIPLDPLLVTDLALELGYPAYLRRPSERLRRPFSTLAIPEGTTITVRGAANAPLSEVTLIPPGGRAGDPAISFTIDGRSFEGGLRPRTSGEWRWGIIAAGRPTGLVLPPPLDIRVVRDNLPEVRILHPEGDRALGSTLRLPLVVDAQDDIGISDVELVSWKESAVGAGPAMATSIVPSEPAARMILRAVVEGGEHELLPGDTLYYFVLARDGHPGHAAASSDTLRAFLPTLSQLREAAALGADALAQGADRTAEAIDDLERRAREAEGRARAAAPVEASGSRSLGSERPEGLSYEATEEARHVLERTEELARQLQEMTDRAGALEGMSEALLDAGLREEMAELQELYHRLLDSELAERIGALREALRELRPERLQTALGRLAEDSGRLREDLERSAAVLERVGLEQGVKSARNSAEELARRQDAIAQAPDVDEMWQHAEESLASDAEQLGRQIEELSDRLDSSLSAGVSATASDSVRAAGEAVSEAAHRARAAAQSAGDAGEPPGNRTMGSSSEAEASQAADRLGEAASMLAAAEQALGRDWSAEAMESLGRARREALALAGEQAELAEGYSGPTALDPATLQGRQAALRSGLENLFGSLAEAGRRTTLLDRGASVAAAEAAGRMDDLLSRLQGGSVGRPTGAEATAVAAALNELAARLLASSGAVQAARSGSGSGEMLERLSRAARAQEGLSREGGWLLFMQDDGRPVGSRLEQLAQGQAQVEKDLRELADRAGDREDLVVRPEALAQEAGELARRLESGALDPETVERQATLFRRLLDAGRSLEQEDEEPDRRESRPGSDLSSQVPPLDPALMAGPRYPHPDEASLRTLPPAYRWMVLDYFDRLNRVVDEQTEGSGEPEGESKVRVGEPESSRP